MALACLLFLSHSLSAEVWAPSTFCNPLDLSYRFCLEEPSRREAADPSIIFWKGEYWLFASKSGGYWHSKDFFHWQFVIPTGLPLENYAPTAEIINGGLYWTAGSAMAMFTSADPAKGEWTNVGKMENYTDPAFFADDDGRVYMYFGTSAKDPIEAVEIDAKTFAQIGKPAFGLLAEPAKHGWELKRPEASNAEIAKGVGAPFIEGAWMTKHDRTYYLQYAGPGTEKKWYADGVYTSSSPLGPFTYASYNPFCMRASGFLGGTGHGNTFTDEKGNYWHSTCALIGVRAGFERRLAVFPTGFVPNPSGPAQMVSQTYLGDYPQYLPGKAADPFKNNSPGWMLLSYKKTATASSFLPKFPVEQAFDEDIMTWWSAATGNPGEWLAVDLGKICEIRAIQINFADEGSKVLGRLDQDSYRYNLEISSDGKTWTPFISREENTRDAPHEYIELEKPVRTQYLRITNVHTPAQANFSISGLRLFGSGLGQAPGKVDGLNVQRMPEKRQALLRWNPVKDADFYIVRYGMAKDRLYLNHQVYGETFLNLSGLNTDGDYFFTVDAVNDSGITMGTETIAAVPTQLLDRKGWTASASDSSAKDPVVNVLDGDPETRWGTGSKQAPGQWFQVDLGSAFTILQIDLQSVPGDWPRDYEVFFSNDGQNWGKPVASGKGEAKSRSITVQPQATRYIRIVQNGATDGPWWSVSEFNVIGSPAKP